MLLNADDDRELARALVDHTDVDTRVRDRVEYSCRSSLVLDHTETYDCDERKSILYGDAVGTDRSVDRGQHFIASAVKNSTFDDYTHIINSRGEMLKGDIVVLKYLKDLSYVSDLGVHHILLDRDDREALTARDTRDDLLGVEVAYVLGNDHRTGILGAIGILDVYRNACVLYGEDRILVEHGRAHVRKLAKLSVGDGLDGTWIVDNSGVCHKEARNVGPVLVQIGIKCARNNRARNIRAAARKCLDGSVGHNSVKSGNYRGSVLHKLLTHSLICLFLVERAVILEVDNVLSVDKVELEVLCKNERVEIFTAACRKVTAGAVHHSILYVFKLTRDIEIESESFDDGIVSVGYLCVKLVDILVVTDLFVALVKHICDLGIFLESLAGRRRNYVTAVGVSLDYACYLLEMLGVRKRTSAEFYYFNFHNLNLPLLK